MRAPPLASLLAFVEENSSDLSRCDVIALDSVVEHFVPEFMHEVVVARSDLI